MNTLADRLADARAAVARLEQEAAAATCADLGHDWEFLGGRNAGCCDWCSCSVPVHVCTRCADCDYGDNEEAATVRRRCADA